MVWAAPSGRGPVIRRLKGKAVLLACLLSFLEGNYIYLTVPAPGPATLVTTLQSIKVDWQPNALSESFQYRIGTIEASIPME